MIKAFNLDQIENALEGIDITKAIEEGFIASSEGKVVVPLVGEMIFDNPPGETHIKYGGCYV
jgi:ornithine cyclodeaminase